MSYKKAKIIALILFSILLLLILFAYKNYIYAPEPFYKPSAAVENNTHRQLWNKYGYSFLYTDEYILQSPGPEPKPFEDDHFGLHRNGEPILNTTISIHKLGNLNGQQLLDYSTQYFTKWLKTEHASSKLQPSYSGGLIDVRSYPFITPQDIKGYEFYLTTEMIEDVSKSKKWKDRLGPFITFQVSDPTSSSPAVFLIFGGDTFEGRDAVRLFLDSLTPINNL